jgi:hypothetical protein
MRGRELFARENQSSVKLECIECHGPQGKGNGPRFVAQEVFNDVVFGGDPSTQDERLQKYDEKTLEAWRTSLDDWKQPLRPNNLNMGVYKGGRRPIDIYWRIAKGINGALMPAHDTILTPEQIWDVVNFVLALPSEPKLLEDVKPPAGTAAPAHAVARH